MWHDEQWYFSIVDVIEILTDSPKPTAYWNKVQKALEAESELYPKWIKLKLVGQDGKSRPSDCANTQGILRIVMSVPSPKAEPLKLWLAQVGTERIEETENPEIGFERLRNIYRAKGYPDEWIDTCIQSIDIRKQLTEEWKNRGVKEGQEYSIIHHLSFIITYAFNHFYQPRFSQQYQPQSIAAAYFRTRCSYFCF